MTQLSPNSLWRKFYDFVIHGDISRPQHLQMCRQLGHSTEAQCGDCINSSHTDILWSLIFGFEVCQWLWAVQAHSKLRLHKLTWLMEKWLSVLCVNNGLATWSCTGHIVASQQFTLTRQPQLWLLRQQAEKGSGILPATGPFHMWRSDPPAA